MLKKIFRQKFVFIERKLRESNNVAFVVMVTNLPWQQKTTASVSLTGSNLVFTVLTVLKLFATVLCKCCHYTPELRFQTIIQKLEKGPTSNLIKHFESC